MGFGFGPIPTFAQLTSVSPTGTASTSLVMLGLGLTITPTVTGRVMMLICGNAQSNTTNDGGQWVLAYGTGGSPTNGGAATGTAVGSAQRITQDLASTDQYPFCLQWFVPTLIVGTTYWIDLQFAALTGGTFSLSNIAATAWEM